MKIPSLSALLAIQPRLASRHSEPVPARPSAPAGGRPGGGLLADVAQGRDVRAISPREMTTLSFDLHLAGLLPYEEYAVLAFQPELHPDFDRTTGALTGEKADPDRPRDFIALLEDRLRAEQVRTPADEATQRRTTHLLEVLRRIEEPVDVVV